MRSIAEQQLSFAIQWVWGHKTVKFWLICFGLAFVGAELSQTLVQSLSGAGLELSMPLTLLGGLGLAFVSNARRSQGLSGSLNPTAPAATKLSQTLPQPSNPQPPAVSQSAAAKSISFEIRPPERS